VGVAAVLLTPREEDPQIVVPLADIYVQYPGASAAEIEQLIATPLEKLLWQIDGVEYVYENIYDSEGNLVGEGPVEIPGGGIAVVPGPDKKKVYSVAFDETGRIFDKTEIPYGVRIRLASLTTETHREPINQKIMSFNVCYEHSSKIEGTKSIYIIRDLNNPSFNGIGYDLEFDAPVSQDITKVFNLDSIAQEYQIEYPKVYVLEDLEGCNIQIIEPQNLEIEPGQEYNIMSTDGNVELQITEGTFTEATTGTLNKVWISNCEIGDLSYDLSSFASPIDINLGDRSLGEFDIQQTFDQYGAIDFWKRGLYTMEEIVFQISQELNNGLPGEDILSENLQIETELPSMVNLYESFGVKVKMDSR